MVELRNACTIKYVTSQARKEIPKIHNTDGRLGPNSSWQRICGLFRVLRPVGTNTHQLWTASARPSLNPKP